MDDTTNTIEAVEAVAVGAVPVEAAAVETNVEIKKKPKLEIKMESKPDMDILLDGIDREKETRFKNTWVKLDKGSKMNRIHLFIKKEKVRLFLEDSEEKQLKFLIMNLFNSGSFNKASSIEYSTELFEIIEIKNITFDEKRRKFNYAAQLKIKSDNGGSKSKSNIEKHFSRSKGNKQTE